MFNLHRLGLVLVVGGFAAICASMFTNAAETVTSNALLSTIIETSNKSDTETTDQLARWGRRYYRTPSWSPTTNTTPLAPLPTATATPVPVTQQPQQNNPPAPTKTPVPSSSSALVIVGEVLLGKGDGAIDSGTKSLSSGEALKLTCVLEDLSISKNSSQSWEADCTGPWDEDHVVIKCASPAALSDSNVNPLSRVVACSTGNTTTTTSSAPQSSGSSQPQAPAATSTPSPTSTPPPVVVPTTTSSGGTQTTSGCIHADTPGQVIQNLVINANCGDIAIDVTANNVTIRNVTIIGGGTNVRFHQVSGGVIENSTLQNPKGGGYVQQISVDKSSNITIRNNTLTCQGGSACNQEDAVGIFQSNNITVQGNSIIGGNSDSGCGVMMDGGSTNVRVLSNTIRDHANCGVGVASGTDHVVSGNNVSDYGNVGIYVWNQYGGSCSRITISNNSVSGNNPWWDGGNCSQLSVTGNSFD